MLLKDTYKAVNTLKEAGLPAEQAERIVGLFQEADEQVSTKQDIELLREELKGEMNALEDRLSGEMNILREEMNTLHEQVKGFRNQVIINVWAVGATVVGLLAALNLL